jgi:hypothetical protein
VTSAHYTTEQLASVYAQTSRHNPDTHYAFVSFRLKAEFKRYDMDSEEMLEALRASALAKLSEAEIRALGAEKLAVYNKLKFHNADDRLMKTDEIIEEPYTVLGRRAKDGSLEFWSDFEFDSDIDCADDYSAMPNPAL